MDGSDKLSDVAPRQPEVPTGIPNVPVKVAYDVRGSLRRKVLVST